MATNNSLNENQTGLQSYDGAGVFAGRTLTPPAAGITVTNGNGVSGNPTLALADDLAAVEGLGTTGLAARTAASTWTTRTLTAGTGVSITNGDGVAGNPTISATTAVPTTFTEDSGTATPSANNLNVLGTAAQGISTSGSGATVTITAANATALQKGVASFNSTNFTATSGNITSNALTVTAGTGLTGGGSVNLGGTTTINLDSPVSVAHGGTGDTTLTANGVLYGNGTSAVGATAAGTDGQVLIAATGTSPAFSTVTGSNGITLTPGAHSLAISNVNIPNSALQNSSITIANGGGITVSGSPVSLGGTVTLSASGSVPTTFTEDTGTATPALNNINVLGTSTQGISTSGSGSTVTITASNASTSQKGVVALATNAETIAGTDTAKAVTADDVKAKLGTQTAHSLALFQGTSSAMTPLGAATNGQIPIGSTGADPVLAVPVQPSEGLTITGGAGSLTFALANDLAAVEGLSTTGIAARTATSTWTTRTITAGTGISVSNGDGVSGNPTISATGGGPPSSFVASQLDFVDDFVSGFDLTKTTTGNIGNWYFDNSGAALSMNLESAVGRPGVWSLVTAGSPLSCSLSLTKGNTSYGTIVVTGGVITCVWSAKLEILSTVSGRFTAQLGMLNPSLATTQTDGFYFSYTDTVNSGKWQIVNAFNSSRTTTNTSVTADTNYHDFKIVINSGGTSVEYFIDGVSVGTIATNICLNLVSPSVVLIQTSGSGASGAIDLDYVTLNQVFTSSR